MVPVFLIVITQWLMIALVLRCRRGHPTSERVREVLSAGAGAGVVGSEVVCSSRRRDGRDNSAHC